MLRNARVHSRVLGQREAILPDSVSAFSFELGRDKYGPGEPVLFV